MLVSEDKGLFAPCVDICIDRIEKQLAYNALEIVGFDTRLMESPGAEMHFPQELARAGKIARGRFPARKKA